MAAKAAAAGYRVSALGLGTAQGGVFEAPGGLAQARLDAPSLRALAASGGGGYRALAADDADLRALGVLAEQAGGHAAYGVHPLFDVGARGLEGETVYLAAAPEPHANAHVWLVELLRSLGGTVRFGTAARHDESMAYVHAMAHQALLGFAGAVVESGLDLHDDVWAARTPLFETLFGMAVRALDESQQQTFAGVQTSLDGPRAAAALAASAQLLRAAVDTGDTDAIAARMSRIRDRFSGALFDTVRGTAAAAVVAAQAKRAELARHMRNGELVGIRPIGRADSLRVGRIVDVDPVAVTLQEVLVGRPGRAALLDGPGRHNAARLGLGGKLRLTVFSLGHVGTPSPGRARWEAKRRATRVWNWVLRSTVTGNPEATANSSADVLWR